MGNYRFRLSDMIPNAWFYKLKDMSKPRTGKHYTSHPLKKKPQNKHPIPSYSNNYYFTTEPSKPEANFYPIEASVPPRKSLKRRDRRRTVYKPSPRPRVTSSVSEHSPDYSLSPFETTSPSPNSFVSESDDDDFFAPNSTNCKLTSSTTDIIIDMMNIHSHNNKPEDGFYSISQLDLPPILTKPKSNQKADEFSKSEETKARKVVKQDSNMNRTRKDQPIGRKSFGNSPTAGIKLRPNSPKIASKKIQSYARRSMTPAPCTYLKSRNRRIAESFAVVKSSMDPQKDFRDSMVEMIVENNIRRDSKDMEDLLASYLSLNSNQYHPLIIKAFEQIWLDMTNLRL